MTPRSKRHEQDVAALRRQIDVKVVAEALHCTPKHIYDLAKSGELTYSRDGRNITFELADVQAYQASIRIVATR